MQLQGVVPSVITCNALISSCEKPERTPEVFKAMQLQGVVPHEITSSTLISTYAKG